MRIHIKSCEYRREGKLIKRPGFWKNITMKHKQAAKKNLIKARLVIEQKSGIQRLRSSNSIMKTVSHNLHIQHIPRMEAK